MPRTAQRLREWCHWFHSRGVPLEHTASVLGLPVEDLRGLLAARRRKPDGDAWPFYPLTPEGARRRKILSWTSLYVQRLAALGYDAPELAELLFLDVDVVRCFVRRTRRLRAPRSDRRAPGEQIRPRTPGEELAHKRARDRASKRRRLLELAKPPAGWTYADRSARTEAEDYARFMAAVRAGRLAPAELIELSARVHYGPPRAAEAPAVEPAIWTGAASWHAGKLTADQITEAAELVRAGWSFPKLAARYGCSVSTLRSYVDVGPLRKYGWPTEAAVYPHGVVRWDRPLAEERHMKVWSMCECGRERLIEAYKVFHRSFTARCRHCQALANSRLRRNPSPALSANVALLAELQENPQKTGLLAP